MYALNEWLDVDMLNSLFIVGDAGLISGHICVWCHLLMIVDTFLAFLCRALQHGCRPGQTGPARAGQMLTWCVFPNPRLVTLTLCYLTPPLTVDGIRRNRIGSSITIACGVTFCPIVVQRPDTTGNRTSAVVMGICTQVLVASARVGYLKWLKASSFGTSVVPNIPVPCGCFAIDVGVKLHYRRFRDYSWP